MYNPLSGKKMLIWLKQKILWNLFNKRNKSMFTEEDSEKKLQLSWNTNEKFRPAGPRTRLE